MIKKIKKKLKNFIFNIINHEDINELEKTFKLPNTFINLNNSIHPKTIFNINSKASKVLFEQNIGCRAYCNFLVYPNATLIIREGVYLNNYCSINCLGYIEIGSNTLFGEGVKVYDHNHKHEYKNNVLNIEASNFTIGRILIGKNCWMGSNVTILKNVEIGDNVIIGANCLIYKSVPSNTIVKNSTQLIINSL